MSKTSTQSRRMVRRRAHAHSLDIQPLPLIEAIGMLNSWTHPPLLKGKSRLRRIGEGDGGEQHEFGFIIAATHDQRPHRLGQESDADAGTSPAAP